MRAFLAAVQFLTVCPFPGTWCPDEKTLARGVRWFPAVGLLIGGIAAALDYALGRVFPGLLASVFVVIYMLIVSGGLHIDGLADTADGFFSSRPRERVLEIMKDSRTGPMGVVAIVCVVGLKIAAVTSVPAEARWWTLLMIPLAGRCTLVTNLSVLPYARAEGGLGSVFHKNRSKLQAVWALAVLVLVGWFAAGWLGLAAGVASFAAGLLFALYVYRKIGGLTGDTLGAACELVEIVPALVAAAWLHGGFSI
ncbi:MAG: adenosylcobinamide-GDP ribazoletransferase [Armatimonadota bacterium]